MGRPTGTKNNMRTPEEKEKIILEYFDSGKGAIEFSRYIGIERKQLWKWIKKYREQGIDGLKSNTGKHKNHNVGFRLRKPKDRIEELELELMRKEIEIARLKKGYMVKGDGAEKEFVTTFDKNTK